MPAYAVAAGERYLAAGSAAISDWWASNERLTEGVGYFREVLRPRMEQFETIYTHDYGPLEGVSVLIGSMSEPVIEHGCWGSMHDRLPLSQTETLDPKGALAVKQAIRRTAAASSSPGTTISR